MAENPSGFIQKIDLYYFSIRFTIFNANIFEEFSYNLQQNQNTNLQKFNINLTLKNRRLLRTKI